MEMMLVLENEQKAIILSKFIAMIEKKNRDCGTVFGSYQILEILEDIAIQENFLVCPKCHRSKSC